MSSTSRTVSLKGDEDYKRALTIYATSINRSVAEIVRESLDKVHGDGIQKIHASFFASTAQCDEQSHIGMDDRTA